MTESVAIVYWCDGAGHAARSIPVAKELESRGIDVAMAGGGKGKRFVEMNGFDHPGLPTVTVKGSTPLSFLKHTVFDLIPSCIRRFRAVHRWLQDTDPDVLVSDDIFALVSAAFQGIDFYRIDHLTTDLFGLKWGIPLYIYNSATHRYGEQIIVTSLWPEEDDPDGITRVGPLAQEGDGNGNVDEYDVLLIPGTHGEDFDEIRNQLEAEGYAVRSVGDENWEPKSTMTPYTRAADVVVCTGFSSIADSVVAGTPCVIYPFLPFQKAIAEKAKREEIEGISSGTSVRDVVEKAKHFCEADEKPTFENGASDFVDVLVDD